MSTKSYLECLTIEELKARIKNYLDRMDKMRELAGAAANNVQIQESLNECYDEVARRKTLDWRTYQ
jgi:hypothetical protein